MTYVNMTIIDAKFIHKIFKITVEGGRRENEVFTFSHLYFIFLKEDGNR